MSLVEEIESAENILKDIYGLIYAQTELINRLNCKVAKAQSALNNLERKIKDLKQKEVSSLISK